MVILWYYNGIIIEGKAEEDGSFINARKQNPAPPLIHKE